MRLKDLLGVTLEELKTLLSRRGGARRGARRSCAARTSSRSGAGSSCTRPSATSIASSSWFVIARGELAKLEHELSETRKRVRRKIREHAAG